MGSLEQATRSPSLQSAAIQLPSDLTETHPLAEGVADAKFVKEAVSPSSHENSKEDPPKPAAEDHPLTFADEPEGINDASFELNSPFLTTAPLAGCPVGPETKLPQNSSG